MNKPILCCLKIKSATLLIGILDLIYNATLLATLFASYSHPTFFEHYYTHSISLIASSSSSCISPSISFTDQKSDFSSPVALPIVEQAQIKSQLIPQLAENRQTNTLRQLDGLSAFTQPKQFSSLNNSNNILLPKDKSMVLLITVFSSFITLILVYGIIKKRPSYLMPYFSIKVFQVVMASLTTLGFYSCLPNVRLWIQNHHQFPFKRSILLLDNQTLELFVFSILLAEILVKLYTVIIVWYCYRYMITIESFRTVNLIGGGCTTGANGISFDDNITGFKVDDESMFSQPPKYDEIMKQIKNEKSTPNSNQTLARSSLNDTDSPQSDNELSISTGLVPSYSSAVANKNKIVDV